MPKVALFQYASRPILEEGLAGILETMEKKGFQDGKNIKLTTFNAENDLPTANSIAREIVGSDFDMVVTVSTPCLQVMANANRERKMTHIFGLVTDPFASGVGISRENPLDHPKYMAGCGNFQPVREAFRIAREMNPNLKKVGVVWNPGETCSEACTILARDECKKLGIELIEATVDATAAVREAADSLVSRGVEAIWMGGDNTVEMAVDSIIQAGVRGGIPLFANAPGHASRGALFGLGADYVEVGRFVGSLAADVLNGLDPAKYEIKNVMPERLGINEGVLEKLTDKIWKIPENQRARAAEIYDFKGKLIGGTASAKSSDQKPAAPAPKPADENKTYRVGFVYFGPDPGTEIGLQAFLDGLASSGIVKGKNLEPLVAHAQGEMSNITMILSNYEGQNVDLIVPLTTPCLTSALASIEKIPIVFSIVYDPIAAGAGKSLEDHLPKVTGVGSFPPIEETMKRIQDFVPGVKRVGTLFNPSEANSRKVVEVAREVAPAAGLELVEVGINNSNEIFQAAQVLCNRDIQALWITGDNTALQGFGGIVKAAAEAGIPLINNDLEFLAQGALACVGIGFYEPGFRGGEIAARVLKGESTASIPMENLTAKRIGLNFETAKSQSHEFSSQNIKDASIFVGLPLKLNRQLQLALVGKGISDAVVKAVTQGFHVAGMEKDKDYVLSRLERLAGEKLDGALLMPGASGEGLADGAASMAMPEGNPKNLPDLVNVFAIRMVRSLLLGEKPPVAAPASQEAKTESKPVGKCWKIRSIKYVDELNADDCEKGFLKEFEEAGLKKDIDYTISFGSAQGDMATTVSLIQDFISSENEMLIAISTPVLQSALSKVKDRPLIFTCVADPVKSGAGESYAKHAPNVTGISTMSDFDGMAKTVRECLPDAKKAGTLFVPAESNSVVYRDALAESLAKVGIELVSVAVSNSAEVGEGANSLVAKDIDAICQISDNTTNVAFVGVAQSARKSKMPLFAFVSGHVRSSGAPIAVARDYFQAGRDAAKSAMRVMRGEDPADIPFSLVSHTSVIVNLENARQCGLAIPQSILEKADEVLEK